MTILRKVIPINALQAAKEIELLSIPKKTVVIKENEDGTWTKRTLNVVRRWHIEHSFMIKQWRKFVPRKMWNKINGKYFELHTNGCCEYSPEDATKYDENTSNKKWMESFVNENQHNWITTSTIKKEEALKEISRMDDDLRVADPYVCRMILDKMSDHGAEYVGILTAYLKSSFSYIRTFNEQGELTGYTPEPDKKWCQGKQDFIQNIRSKLPEYKKDRKRYNFTPFTLNELEQLIDKYGPEDITVIAMGLFPWDGKMEEI